MSRLLSVQDRSQKTHLFGLRLRALRFEVGFFAGAMGIPGKGFGRPQSVQRRTKAAISALQRRQWSGMVRFLHVRVL